MRSITFNGWVYETFGISKRFPIKPLHCLLNVPPLKLALSAKCFIYRVVFSCFIPPVSPCVWVAILFDKFWSGRRLFVRLGNVYGYAGWAFIYSSLSVKKYLSRVFNV